ncbi:hypothetical protein TVAG_305340 [Trichomonas vaginalis G3]|uniref:Uncharacterized protein n=1 Tax=Trichomonas vaginalis (strain ATCC PRA-98 / G3) TaxID=412133 RepID=A2ERA9_TRIV3|nr:hypothetical protein TVAGG3_1003810 [Trichomonas vaginalis G3]EAY04785.1 hypothetical protein TVAG_305340 [Trichomonas vaginalis G3]KAI5490986.1 hypothetical protein TVAGG3_1003810 [Trichomonas vaginalis G3]|eukprot:XP_001317008.1 hypothetical protein [Trichomonas vaginalis G3]
MGDDDRNRPQGESKDPDVPRYDWESNKNQNPVHDGKINWDFKNPDAVEEEIKKIDRNVRFDLKSRTRKDIPEPDEKFYNFRASDIAVGFNNRPPTFAKRSGAPKERKTARIRFNIDGEYSDLLLEATFNITEGCDEIHSFLKGEIFIPESEFNISMVFPPKPVINSNQRDLYTMNIVGNVQLNVTIKSKAILKPEWRQKFKELLEEKEAAAKAVEPQEPPKEP